VSHPELLVVINPARSEAIDAARRTADWAASVGWTVRLPAEDAALCDLPNTSWTDVPPAGDFALAVSLGGDGTMLRTVDLLGGAPVPILGVNIGQLGYLTEIEPPALEESLARVVSGDFGIERRMLLEVLVDTDGTDAERYLALNEAVLEKTSTGQTVRLDVDIDGRPFTPYETDGLIIATPTGSTAYAFSVRGPIVAPTHRLVLLTPVSPHMLFDRTLVLEPDTELRLEVDGHRSAALSIDGRPRLVLDPGRVVRCRAADEEVHLVTFVPRDFHNILKAKFGLADR